MRNYYKEKMREELKWKIKIKKWLLKN
jgi:hypothetical protein